VTEVWATGISLPGVAVRMAQRAEADGFDGWFVVDSQNLAGDCYVALALAAQATERIQLGTGVTNPYTRHPAVTASAIASVHAASGGRAVLGIGRGDSALAHLGLAPAPVPVFERYLTQLQAYLRGDEVPFAELTSGAVDEVGTLGLAGGPTGSRLHWLSPDLPKVPVTVAATGPKVIDVAARVADRVTFALGADPERVTWGIERARAARADVRLGAFVNVVCHDDVDVARALASGGMSTFARFNVMHGTTHGPMGDDARSLLQDVHDAYDMRTHTQAGSPQAERLTSEFAEGFAILGPADRCIERLQHLVALGLDHLVIVGPSLGADPTEARAAHTRFVTEVLPAVQAT
jgi:5,10-methylenetetrahydromethanopterin reductase